LEWGTSCYGERGRYNGGLGAEPPARVQGAEPQVRGVRGESPPEAEKLFACAHPAEAANVSYFLFICSILHVHAWTDF